ncbi:glutathione S-transferase LANCL1 [Pelomyxa schiedti]|nr:glutathione S-transferase LANCL1 [Pelomyxa schiedti]
MFPDYNTTSIPPKYRQQMQDFIDVAVALVLDDFPPDYQGCCLPAVYWGSCGIGAMFLRLYKQSGNEGYLNHAKEYVDYSLLNYPTDYPGYEVAFQKGRIGVCAVGAVLYDILGNSTKVNELIEEVNWIFDQTKPGDYFDWESGLSGIVYAGDYLNNYFGKEVVSSEKIKRVLELIFEEGIQNENQTSGALLYEYYEGHYWTGFGSHGSGSPVYTLLNHNLLVNDTVLQHARATVDYYLELQTPEGQIPGDKRPDRTQWCHGIPGLLGPIGEAYRVFHDDKYRQSGLLGSQLISEIGILTKGMMLCHGVSANVYMMIDFYRKTGDTIVLQQAVSMVLTALETAQLTSLDPTQWDSYDCVPEALFGSSPMGAILLFSDILYNFNDLTKLQFLTYNLEY